MTLNLDWFYQQAEITSTGCWLWERTDKEGYPYFGKLRLNRFIFKLVNGPISSSVEVHHTCLNTACINPNHLQALTNAEHHIAHTMTHCRRGHLFTSENTRYQGRQRLCRTCVVNRQNDRNRRMRERRDAHF